VSDLNGELLTVLATASEERKAEALRVLRGEVVPGAGSDPGPEPYLTLREVGRRLGVSPCSLWRWDVPGHALGGRRRFRLTEVLEYLESNAFKRRAEQLKKDRRGA
jgi:hypothetical protein